MTPPARTYLGSCHCGALAFTYQTALEPSSWPVRECQCSFCRSHQALTTSDPQGLIEFAQANGERLNRYRFGERTADFLICRECGVYIGTVIETARGKFGIVNIRALRPRPSGLPQPAAMDYAAESREERIGRRELRWTPVAAAER